MTNVPHPSHALLTTFPGDPTMSIVEEVRAVAKGGSARIQR
jgi:2-dehydro-3-deoxygluconokinase